MYINYQMLTIYVLGVQHPLNRPVAFPGSVATLDLVLQMFLLRSFITPPILRLLHERPKRNRLVCVPVGLRVEPFAHLCCPHKISLMVSGSIS